MSGFTLNHARIPRWGYVIVSILLASLLNVIPLPSNIQAFWPDWVTLVVFYWVIVLPMYLGLTFGWLGGLLQDILMFSLLGQNALMKAFTALIAGLVSKRFSLFNVLEKILLVFIVQLINTLIVSWIALLAFDMAFVDRWYLTAFTTALMWPLVSTLLDYFDPEI